MPIEIQKQKPRSVLQHNYHKYVVRFEDRETRDFIKKSIKQTGKFKPAVHYGCPLSDHGCFDNINFRKDDTPNSKTASQTIMSLPIHPFLTDDEINTVIESIVGIL
jgi:dTDP-4-amino-4,6-dideoxygalactose transaminase